jgi:Domain of unknown function (DUF222)
MIEPRLAFPERPSLFEEGLRRWLDGAGRRIRVDFVPARPAPTFVVGCAPHGRRSPASAESVPAAVASFARLLEAGAGHLAAVRAARLAQCRSAAVQARELAAFAALRPSAVLDRPDDEVGAAAAASRTARSAALTAVSEWAVDEVMAALALSSAAASQLLAESVTLVGQLPATLAALEAGTIGWTHARMLVEVLAPLTDEARAEVEGRLLAGAAGKTVTQLRIAARRAVLRADAAAAARRLAAAIRDRRVRVYPGEDGMASLAAAMSTPVALACRNALEQYAEACATPGDERTKDQRMVDCLADLILRPGETGLPPVQAQLTVVASVDTLRDGDEPGEIDGQPVPAVLVRELAHTLGLLPRSGPAPGAVDSLPAASTAEVGDSPPARTDNEAAAVRVAQLLGVATVAGTALTGPPAIAVVEELTGQLLALTDAAGIRAAATCRRRACRTGARPCTHRPAGPGLGPPADSPGYTPSAALRRFVRARDRRCRFPGCRAPAIRCDLDHNQPWPAGPTSAGNLCCLCRHHHRLSHQAPGWTMHRLPDGGLQWTTPGGHRITTHPTRYGTDDDLTSDDLPPPKSRRPIAPTPALTASERVLGRPRLPGTVDDDPAPF